MSVLKRGGKTGASSSSILQTMPCQQVCYNKHVSTTDSSSTEQFFHGISVAILNLVANKYRKSQIVKQKGDDRTNINFVTGCDIETEKVIIEEIRKRFPKDLIISEENFSEVKINDTNRFWIIDPICGTANFAREINLFVSNIALAHKGELIASCVIDHSENEYIWSTGGRKVFINNAEVKINKKSPGIIIDVDLTGLIKSSKKTKEKYCAFVSRLITETNYTVVTHATSLSFAYTSIGRIDAYVCEDINLWDVAAANFLITQSGGIISDFSGSPWTLYSHNVVTSRDKNLHKQLVELINDNRL